MALLDKINSPADLKEIPRNDLPKLAEEIRWAIVDAVSQTGGHLAPSLGAVELALARLGAGDGGRRCHVGLLFHAASRRVSSYGPGSRSGSSRRPDGDLNPST